MAQKHPLPSNGALTLLLKIFECKILEYTIESLNRNQFYMILYLNKVIVTEFISKLSKLVNYIET